MIQFNKIDSFQNVWITSDSHYNHKNITRGVSSWDGENGAINTRDFQTLDEMNAAIVKGINDHVKPDDLLIHCGDWSFGGAPRIPEFRKQLNVNVIFGTYGNHDHNIVSQKAPNPFSLSDHILYLKYRGLEMVISHYPIISHHRHHHGSVMLHGHCHGSLNEGVPGKILDVGVDVAFDMFGEYRPFSFKEVATYMSGRETTFASHHNKTTS